MQLLGQFEGLVCTSRGYWEGALAEEWIQIQVDGACHGHGHHEAEAIAKKIPYQHETSSA